jgi:NADH-quinone oxidoreductase subunit E
MTVRRLAEKQPEAFDFTPANKTWCDEQIAKYPEHRQASAVIPLLWKAQAQHAYWLPQKAIEKVADMLGMPYIRVLEIATFYSMFNLEPVGQHFIQMCGTTPCMLRGSNDIKAVLEKRIGGQRDVTADGKFSWLEVECLGACCNAPMVQINDDYYEDLTPENFEKLLDDLAAGNPVKKGSQTGKTSSEPEPGKAYTLSDASLYDGSQVGAWQKRFEDDIVAQKAKAEAAAAEKVKAEAEASEKAKAEATEKAKAEAAGKAKAEATEKAEAEAAAIARVEAEKAAAMKVETEKAAAAAASSHPAEVQAAATGSATGGQAKVEASGGRHGELAPSTSSSAMEKASLLDASASNASSSSLSAEDLQVVADREKRAAQEETEVAALLAKIAPDAAPEVKADAVGSRPKGLDGPRGTAGDDLKRIKGIGPVNETKLNQLGVFHFDQIAGWSRPEVRWVGTYLSFPGRIDREDWQGQARELMASEAVDKAASDHGAPGVDAGTPFDSDAEEADIKAKVAALGKDATPEQKGDAVGTRPAGLAVARGGVADDLKRVKGIGKVNESKLNSLGIFHFDQIGAWTRPEIRWAGAYLSFAGRIDREDWVGQAKLLAAGHETEFSQRVDAGQVASSAGGPSRPDKTK